MIVSAYKTHKITEEDTDILVVLDRYLPKKIEENSVVAITSKIIAITEGKTLPIEKTDKDELVKQEADLYIPREDNQYNVYLTIKDNILGVTAGIDESNANNHYILWPSDPQKTSNIIRKYLAKKYHLKNLGVIITDSKSTVLRWGVTGITLAHSGFTALNNKIGTPDIFGHELKLTQVNISDGLAAASVLEMGEANEQTPLAIISKIPYVEFQDRNPSQEELRVLHYDMQKDMYANVLTAAPWKKSKG